jgi:hypothetical protein
MTNLPNNIVKKIEESSIDITTSKFDKQTLMAMEKLQNLTRKTSTIMKNF